MNIDADNIANAARNTETNSAETERTCVARMRRERAKLWHSAVAWCQTRTDSSIDRGFSIITLTADSG